MMHNMKNDDVQHLATLSRIKLNEAEINEFTKEISEILDYVGTIEAMVAEDIDNQPEVGARYNVFREDIVTNQSDSYSKEILAEMPKKQGRYLEVKKILKIDSN